MRKIKSTWPILFLFALFFSVLASGCRTQKVLKEKESTVNIDSLTQVISKLTEVDIQNMNSDFIRLASI